MYVGLGCLFHTAKVPSANNCYILNFFQEYLHCNTFHSYKSFCPYIYSCRVIFRVSESQSVVFETGPVHFIQPLWFGSTSVSV